MTNEIFRLMHYRSGTSDNLLFLNFCISLEAGEIHALAGLSAEQRGNLTAFLLGDEDAGTGNLFIYGKAVSGSGHRAENRKKISCVFPESSLAQHMSVAENMSLISEREPGKFVISHSASVRSCNRVLYKYKLDVDPDRNVRDLSRLERTELELVKCMESGARILVMNRDIQSFSDADSALFRDFLHELCQEGASVLLLTGSLWQQELLADRATAVRNGMAIKSFERFEASETLLRSCILNREGFVSYSAADSQMREGIRVPADGFRRIRNENFFMTFGFGEITGLLDESYELTGELLLYVREKILELLSEKRKKQKKSVLYIDHPVHPAHFVPAFSVEDNINLESFRSLSHMAGVLRKRFLKKSAENAASAVGIKGSLHGQIRQDLYLPVQMCRIAVSPAYFLIIARPFVGLSVTEEEEFKRFLHAEAQKGKCIILSTTRYSDIETICSHGYEIRNHSLIETGRISDNVISDGDGI